MIKTLLKKSIVVASHNKGKIKEFKSLFSRYNVKITTSSSIGIEEVDETGKTFEENAVLKAKSIPEGLISLSDDSGLCIKALKDEPGILSARFARNCGGWYEAMRKLYEKIKINNLNSTDAKFVSVIALRWEDSSLSLFRGEINGFISWPPRGENGFGYDPFFIPSGYKKTFGQMNHDKKILIDHRYQAFKKIAKLHLKNN